jgi:hypothetical protein
MTYEPNIDSFRYEPYDPGEAEGLADAELELMLAELEVVLPPEIEAEGGDHLDRGADG